MAATSSSARESEPSPCEINDWEWTKFKKEFDISNWDSTKVGQSRIGIALIGLGRIGLVHLRNIFRIPRAKLLYCFDIDQARLEACSKSMFFKEFNIKALSSTQFQLALDDPEVKAIIVASPTATHENLVKLSLNAKKCVLCEKPLTLDQTSILNLYELARVNRVFLTTAFNRHYDSDWQRMRQRAGMGSVGPIQLIRIISRNGQRPTMTYLKTSGNCFYDTAIHDLDMMIWLMRQLPSSVQVTTKTWKQFLKSDPEFMKRLSDDEVALLPKINDYFLVVITLQFPNGSIGIIDTSRYSNYGNDQRCEIYGSMGMIKCDGQNSSNIYESNKNGVTNPGINFTFESRYVKAYEKELDEFLTMTDLASREIYDDKETVAGYLSDMPRGTLVAAATRLAEICSWAAESDQMQDIEWPEEFQEKFNEEIRF